MTLYFIEKATITQLENIAGHYGNLKCVEADNEMEAYLKKNKKHAYRIELRYISGRGYIYSDTLNAVISYNGFHVGILYRGMVYCNIHPYGLPEVAWLNDFHGTGYRTVTRIPI